jgi:DNA-binding MarR family transcriptional regulator
VPDPEPDLPLWELVQTYFVVARGFAEVFAAERLTPTQFGVLATLADGEDLSQSELARVLMVRPQSLADVAVPLIERGLVERDGPGGRGRRAALRATDEGRAVLGRVLPAVAAFNAPETSGLTTAEAVELTRLLRAVRAALGPA